MLNLRAELQQRCDAQLYRQRRILQTAQGPEVIYDNRSLLVFCSNDYLGLANHPKINAAFCRGVERWGSGSGAAHLICGHTAAHHALEEELAAFTGRARALLFSTGYMANLGIANALLQRHDRVFADRLNHASLIDAALASPAQLVRYRHADTRDLAEKFQQHARGQSLVMTDGVFSMDGDIAPLSQLAAICAQHNAWLMVDDAHGLGVVPDNGLGSVAWHQLGVEQVPVLMGTLGKAFGTFGAFVAGSEDLIETLIQRARSYIYTTALPAANAEASRASLALVQQDTWRRQRLQELIRQFQRGADELGLPRMPSPTPIQPLLVQSSERALALSEALFEHGILVTAIRPPTVPKNTARLRITFSATHTDQHLQQLFQVLEKVF